MGEFLYTIALFGTPALIFMAIVWLCGYFNRCPRCKKRWAMVRVTELHRLDGLYDKFYRCKYCNHHVMSHEAGGD